MTATDLTPGDLDVILRALDRERVIWHEWRDNKAERKNICDAKLDEIQQAKEKIHRLRWPGASTT